MSQQEYFFTIKNWLLDLDFNITFEDTKSKLLIIEKEQEGIKNLVLFISSSILILEQVLFVLHIDSNTVYKELLKKNRDIVHGAMVLDESGTKVIFRDTLQMENLNVNELIGSINSLSLLLSEYSNEILSFSKI